MSGNGSRARRVEATRRACADVCRLRGAEMPPPPFGNERQDRIYAKQYANYRRSYRHMEQMRSELAEAYGYDAMTTKKPMKRLSSKAMRTAPKQVWLQLGNDPEAARCNFSELSEVTWSTGKETLVCVEYVRADLVRAAIPVNVTNDGAPELQRLAELLGMTANA